MRLDGHNARDNRHRDTLCSHELDPCQKAIDVIKQLRDNEIGTCIDLCFQMVELGVFVPSMLRVSVRVSCDPMSTPGVDLGLGTHPQLRCRNGMSTLASPGCRTPGQ